MAKRLVNVDRDTPLLPPPSIQEWIPQDDMSRFIVDAVGLLEERHFGYNWRGSGSEQYPPRMTLALPIYSYANRLFSSRRIERATYRDIAVRYITADTHPDHDTIAKFRRENGALIKTCFIEVLALAREMKVLKIGDVATDGSKLEANAAKRQVKTKHDLQLELQAVEARVESLLQQAEQTDRSGDHAADGNRLPAALGDAIARRDKLQAAIARLDENKLRDSQKRAIEREESGHDGPGEPPREIPAANSPPWFNKSSKTIRKPGACLPTRAMTTPRRSIRSRKPMESSFTARRNPQDARPTLKRARAGRGNAPRNSGKA